MNSVQNKFVKKLTQSQGLGNSDCFFFLKYKVSMRVTILIFAVQLFFNAKSRLTVCYIFTASFKEQHTR